MCAFEGLQAGQFIVTDHLLALLSQLRGALIQVVDIADLLICLVVKTRRQPIPDQMGFDIALFLKDVRRDALICLRQSDVG